MDSLTVRELARELDSRWRGRRVEALSLDREARAITLVIGETPVRIDLATPGARVSAASAPSRGAGPVRGWTVKEVRAPVDDRRLEIAFTRPGRFKGSPDRSAALTVSFVPAAPAAQLRDDGGAVLGAIGGALPPPVAPRRVLSDDEVLAATRAGDPRGLRDGRWMSADVARWIIADPARALERHRLIQSDAASGAWRCGRRIVPLPLCDGAEPVASLIEPVEAADERPSRSRFSGVDRIRARMEEELARARTAPRVRAIASALATLGGAPAPETVVLDDGERASVPRHPGESAADAATRLFSEARRMERALATLPARLAALAEPAADSTSGERRRVPGAGRTGPRLPYRTYRSSGGLDIWVGRGAAANDALTFHAAAPRDVWMHARDAAGAHVVLRWPHDEAPPARDLEEAAALAAWHSKARGSTVVPVDWTRRKHVRKPRGGAPGLVLVDRARTIFARPSAELEKKLRA